MTRTRFTAAALSAAVLGLTAALIPTASIAAADPVATPPASPQVTWADGPDHFTPFDGAITDEWRWLAPFSSEEDSLGDFAAFDANGVHGNGVDPLALVHGFPKPVQPAAVPALIAGASANAGPAVTVGLLVSDTVVDTDVPSQSFRTVFAAEGLQGPATQWDGYGDGTVSTAVLAQLLDEEEATVLGYFVSFPSAPVRTDDPGAEDADPSDEQFLELLSAPAGVALRAAVPDFAGIADLRFGDLTTYFTPQPTAALTLARASFTSVQASTTGIPVSGTGFAPGETVTVGLGTGQSGGEIEGVTFVADADGNVSGTVVLPAGLEPGDFYTLALVGASSGQFASNAFAIAAAAAPVAVPVPGEATFTG
ncbi:hypothetical protein [Microbacterium sp. 179-I 3D4 NHS]|uniref:hypothetical protein n=1 Tax=Microbacterium sp. 179-I 3D4 NHS TaxID=3142381 RepID=UPI0039A11DFC